MKVAITGKGGVGKTTIAGTVARQMARRGRPIVALDCDPNPTLGISLGLTREQIAGLQPVINALWDSGYTHDDPKISPDELLHRYGFEAPDGVRLLLTGLIEPTPGRCVCCGSHSTTRAVFGEIEAADRHVIADLEAGLNDLIWAHPAPGDTVLIVVEESAKSIEIGVRAVGLAREMGVDRILGVANRCLASGGSERLAEALGVDMLALPEDPAVEEASRLGIALLDHAAASPAALAIERIAERLA